jgi:ribosomal protein S18 acetylase RimI-like enzyme
MDRLFTTQKGEVAIRIATLEDAHSLFELRLEALTRHPEAYAADIDKTAADGAEAWEKLLTDNTKTHSGTISIACAGSELIGMAGVARGHWPKTRHFGTLWGVYVKPDWRGYRIGEAIVNEIIEWATENDMTVIYLGVTVSEKAAIRCYSRCGFKEYGIEPKSIFYNSFYVDQLLMVKLL